MKKDILKHKLVPEHAILSKTEENKILKQLNVHQEQLPKIKSDDPVVKEIGAKSGDVLKITRRSHTAGKFVTYRLVIK